MKNLSVLALSTLLFTACSVVEIEQVESEPTNEPAPVRETNNVTYTGVVQPAGISVYQQGSHRLVLDGGKFILLESDSLDLNGYVAEEVQIYGALRPTVEAGGMIMRVDRIELLVEEEDPEEEEEEDNAEEEEHDESDEEELEDNDEDNEEEVGQVGDVGEGNEEENDEEELEDNNEEEVEEEEEENQEVSAEMQALIALMARQDYDASKWTQNYCTSHVGFCVPVHKNFWYKSFGATGNTLWYVELSGEPIEKLRDGPITLELLAGSKAEFDGDIQEVNGTVVAYKEWTFGRHFKLSADASLRTAVEYMLLHITDYTN